MSQSSLLGGMPLLIVAACGIGGNGVIGLIKYAMCHWSGPAHLPISAGPYREVCVGKPAFAAPVRGDNQYDRHDGQESSMT